METWRALAAEGTFEALAEALITAHYDPAYRRGSGKDTRPRLGLLDLTDLGPAGLDAAAERIAGLLGSGWGVPA